MSFASFHSTGMQSVEKEHMSTTRMNSFGHFSSDSETEIASQILASFRNTIFQKGRKDNSNDLKDKPIYHTFNEQTDMHVPFTSQGTHHKSSGVSLCLKSNIPPTEKDYEDLTYSQSLSTQEILDHPFVTSVQISTNHVEACWTHDIHQGQDSCFQFGGESTSVVSSTHDIVTETDIDGENFNHDVSDSQQKGDKAYQKTNHELPPCRVCGYKASGFHYGANTCEACKGFFRRSLKKDILEYKCILGENKCVIQKGRRNNCPLCRYNKCLFVGMSKDAIKTGRYTHEKRTQDIIEVKGLKGEPASTVCNIKPISIKIKEENTLGEEQLGLIERIHHAHKALFPFWHKALDSGMLPFLFMDSAEKYRMKQKKQIFNSYVKEEAQFTDVDDRLKTMDVLTKHLELAIMTFVKFAKSIPGFCDLPLNDQASLVKSSRFEVWMIGAHKFVSKEHNMVVGPRGNAFHAEELAEVLDKEFVRQLFEFSVVLQEINLSHEEIAMMKCVVLTFSDRCELEEPKKVEEIQWNLVSCLQAQLNSVKRFSQVMNAFVTLRDLTELNKRISENLVLEWPTIKHNPLLMEVMNI